MSVRDRIANLNSLKTSAITEAAVKNTKSYSSGHVFNNIRTASEAAAVTQKDTTTEQDAVIVNESKTASKNEKENKDEKEEIPETNSIAARIARLKLGQGPLGLHPNPNPKPNPYPYQVHKEGLEDNTKSCDTATDRQYRSSPNPLFPIG
jgi:hypothetical protein